MDGKEKSTSTFGIIIELPDSNGKIKISDCVRSRLLAFNGVPTGIRTPTSGSGGLRDIPFTMGTSAFDIIPLGKTKVKQNGRESLANPWVYYGKIAVGSNGMSKPRVLMVLRPVEGGIRMHVKNLLAHLQEEFAFTVACPPERVVDFLDTGCEILPVPLSAGLSPIADLSAIKKIAVALKASDFSLVHAHGFKAGLVARPASRYVKLPCLVTIHGEFAHAAGSPMAVAYRNVERLLARWSGGYIAVSKWLAGELYSLYGVPRERVAVIPNGIASQHHTVPCATLPFAADDVLVGTVARLAPQKGIEYFVRAAALLRVRFPHVRFVVAGDGPLRMELERVAGELQLDGQLFFVGFIDNVPSLLTKLQVFVQPSLSEGQGITVMEAMAAGCPVVASATGGLPDLVRPGENGLLVAPGNVEELALAIAMLLEQPAWAEELGNQGKLAAKSFGLDEMIEHTKQLYRAVMEGRWPA